VDHGNDRCGRGLPPRWGPALVSVLLGLSLVVCAHPAPVGPVGIVCFAAAVGLLYLRQRRATAAEFSGRERTRAAQV
jgi:hypothetical protein